MYRRLAEANPDAYLPALAMALWAYGWVCVNVKANYAQALESVTKAISVYKPLAEQLPEVFVRHLFSTYRTMAASAWTTTPVRMCGGGRGRGRVSRRCCRRSCLIRRRRCGRGCRWWRKGAFRHIEFVQKVP